MGMNRGNRPWYSWLALVMFIATISVMLYNVFIRTPKAKQAEAQLEKEFALVKPFPQGTAIHSEKSYKDAQALLVTTYSTPAGYPVVREHYDSELTRSGWKFMSERTVNDWGRDLGKNTAHYCKGVWSADLEYMGRETTGGNEDYAIAFGWHGDQPCK